MYPWFRSQQVKSWDSCLRSPPDCIFNHSLSRHTCRREDLFPSLKVSKCFSLVLMLDVYSGPTLADFTLDLSQPMTTLHLDLLDS